MELNGTALAATARMRERTVTSTPPLVTPAPVDAPSAASAALADEGKPGPEPVEALDKYDISLIACTD